MPYPLRGSGTDLCFFPQGVERRKSEGLSWQFLAFWNPNSPTRAEVAQGHGTRSRSLGTCRAPNQIPSTPSVAVWDHNRPIDARVNHPNVWIHMPCMECLGRLDRRSVCDWTTAVGCSRAEPAMLSPATPCLRVLGVLGLNERHQVYIYIYRYHLGPNFQPVTVSIRKGKQLHHEFEPGLY